MNEPVKVPCKCESCMPESPGKTYTIAYMRECFDRHIDRRARQIAALPSLKERQIALIEVSRTAKNIVKLIEARMKEIWAERKSGR